MMGQGVRQMLLWETRHASMELIRGGLPFNPSHLPTVVL